MTAKPDETAVEPVLPGADIIPFPTRALPPPVVLSPQQRLTRALEMLNAAMTEQRTAMTAWRNALADLKTSSGSLSESLERYRSSLQTLSRDVSALHGKAVALRDWAEGASPTQH